MIESYRIIVSNLSNQKQESIIIKHIKDEGIMVSISRSTTKLCNLKFFIIELIQLKNLDDKISIDAIYRYTENLIGISCNILSKKSNYDRCDRLGIYLIPLELPNQLNTKNILCEHCLQDIICLTKKIINIEGKIIFDKLLSIFVLLKRLDLMGDIFNLIINDLIKLYLQR